MNLKEARDIARKVGATIEEKVSNHPSGEMKPFKEYIVRLGVIKIGSSGTREAIVLHAGDPREAAELAVVQTGRAAFALADLAKKAYVDSDLIFGAPRA